jgi:hypothetical protein
MSGRETTALLKLLMFSSVKAEWLRVSRWSTFGPISFELRLILICQLPLPDGLLRTLRSRCEHHLSETKPKSRAAAAFVRGACRCGDAISAVSLVSPRSA